MKKTFIDFHVIQTVPPSCINRDDTGSPKSAVYGGVRRARVSSQSWKSAMRVMFREHFDESELGIRTKKIVDLIADRIKHIDNGKNDGDAKKLAGEIVNLAGVQTKDGMAKALFFMGARQAENAARLVLDGNFTAKKDSEKKNLAKKILTGSHGIDVALFGRMVAIKKNKDRDKSQDASLNADASAQVAHAISTHRVENEYDYYTARDDLAKDDTPGADMIGTIEFNSATLYRYATVAAHDLFKELAEEDIFVKTIQEFARAFILSMPTGKQNTFANRTTPAGVMVTIRSDRPINLADAFERPIQPGKDEGGFTEKSIKQLIQHATDVYENFDCRPEKTFVIGKEFAKLEPPVTLPVLLEGLGKEMAARFGAHASPGVNP
jgi:CRISPR system Cascade subunit CasC